MRNKNKLKKGLCVPLFLVLFILGACERKAGYNILLLTLDTTRADRLRCYGYQNVETPALNSLAREGVLFVRAYAPNPMTLPAHTTILSGTLPIYHGVLDNGGYVVPDSLILLPEVLKEHGYTTAGFVSAAVLKKEFNLDQGFDYWDEEGIKPQPELQALIAERKADAVTDAVLKWLEQNGKKRWFIWVHYFDPHKEYSPPKPYLQLYYFDRYAGEIAFMDSQILRLFDYLKKNHLYEKTIIIAIGDHGESLGEHKEPTHFVFLYEATQNIPFLMRIPGLKNPGKKILNLVSQIDVFPTLLDLVHLKIPAQSQGRSLKKLLYDKELNEMTGEVFLESHYPYLHFGWSELYGLVSEKYKYIQAPKPELYDLSWDPGELNNIAEKNPKLVKEFDERVEKIKKSFGSDLVKEAKADGKLSEETIAQLLALGYLRSKNPVALEKARDKDPKDYADLLVPIIDALNLQAMGQHQELLKKAEQILEKDPENLLVARLKADTLFALGEYQKHITWVKHLLSQFGDNGEFYAQLGVSYLRLGQVEEAKTAFQKAIQLDPTNQMTRYYLARIYLYEGQPEEGLKLIEEANLKEKPVGHLFMALYYLAQGRTGRAESEFELCLEMAPRAPLAKIEYAYYLLDKGDGKKALDLLLEAEKLDPSLKLDPGFQKDKARAQKMIKKGT